MIAEAILAAKLGRERKAAQIDTCTVFAAALYDVLQQRSIPCDVVTAAVKGIAPWAHAVVKVNDAFFDSMGMFSLEIIRARLKIHPSVQLQLEYQPDFREDLFEPEFDELHKFLVKALSKSFDTHRAAPTLSV